jgi:hypothetical protein
MTPKEQAVSILQYALMQFDDRETAIKVARFTVDKLINMPAYNDEYLFEVMDILENTK